VSHAAFLDCSRLCDSGFGRPRPVRLQRRWRRRPARTGWNRPGTTGTTGRRDRRRHRGRRRRGPGWRWRHERWRDRWWGDRRPERRRRGQLWRWDRRRGSGWRWRRGSGRRRRRHDRRRRWNGGLRRWGGWRGSGRRWRLRRRDRRHWRRRGFGRPQWRGRWNRKPVEPLRGNAALTTVGPEALRRVRRCRADSTRSDRLLLVGPLSASSAAARAFSPGGASQGARKPAPGPRERRLDGRALARPWGNAQRMRNPARRPRPAPPCSADRGTCVGHPPA
jgi:hypothetical protein